LLFLSGFASLASVDGPSGPIFFCCPPDLGTWRLMLPEQVMNRLEELADKVAKNEGCILYDVEFVGTGNGRTLRIYIDKVGDGAGIEDCSNVSKGLNEVLDADDVIPGGPYSLEVSTPGIDRVLRKPWHFAAVQGKKVQLKLAKALGEFGAEEKGLLAAKQVSQVVEAADENGIKLKVGEKMIEIPFAAIEKAKVVFEFKTSVKPQNAKANKKR
jgi:ribosome maturation factor RimP